MQIQRFLEASDIGSEQLEKRSYSSGSHKNEPCGFKSSGLSQTRFSNRDDAYKSALQVLEPSPSTIELSI